MPEKNRFAGTLKPKKQTTVEPQIIEPEIEPDTAKPKPKTEPKKLGRPKTGKSSDNKYTQATLYLTTELYKKLKIEAINRNSEISDLAESAIQEYLKSHKS